MNIGRTSIVGQGLVSVADAGRTMVKVGRAIEDAKTLTPLTRRLDDLDRAEGSLRSGLRVLGDDNNEIIVNGQYVYHRADLVAGGWNLRGINEALQAISDTKSSAIRASNASSPHAAQLSINEAGERLRELGADLRTWDKGLIS